MTMLDLAPAPGHDFFSRYLTITPGSLTMDATLGQCSFIARHSGQRLDPYMMHFASNEAPFPYAWQLYKLFKKNGVATDGLFSEALKDFYTMEVLWPLKALLKRVLAGAGLVRA